MTRNLLDPFYHHLHHLMKIALGGCRIQGIDILGFELREEQLRWRGLVSVWAHDTDGHPQFFHHIQGRCGLMITGAIKHDNGVLPPARSFPIQLESEVSEKHGEDLAIGVGLC